MGAESPKATSTPTGAVFLSYASQDAEAAKRICDALRAAGIEVWFDQSELRGGDAWDRQIRKQIHDCALFIPIISANSQARLEGYFRLEWKLAVERTHLMSDRVAFLVPVVIDDTGDAHADVPERFRAVQWTLVPGGVTQPEFAARIKRLLSPEPPTTARLPAGAPSGPSPAPQAADQPSSWSRALRAAVAVLVVGVLAYGLISKPWISKPVGSPATSNATSSPAAPPTAFSPPPHSIAVLPFVNVSGDKEQEYFSDGLTEELLNSLAEINELQVAARTSSFSFKEHPDIVAVAHKLNVATVLEGSVRRSEHTVRVTAQLINAVTGFHLWSKTYDRDLSDVLKLQTEIATAVATALKVTLLRDVGAKIELGGTRNPAAFDAYLRASVAARRHDGKEEQAAIAAFSEAIHLDPKYGLAYAGRSLAYAAYAIEFATGAAIREDFGKAQDDARQAIALAPDIAEGYLALGNFLENASLEFTQASEAYQRAQALAPGSVQVLGLSGRFAALMGHSEIGVAANRRALVLDPLNPRSHHLLGQALYAARRYDDMLVAFTGVISLDRDEKPPYGYRGLAYYGLGDLQKARASCESRPDFWLSQWCLAVVYDKLGRHADAETALADLKAALGDGASYQYATIYAQWGNRVKALEWLETASRVRDPGLTLLKTDLLMDPLRKEPRFQAVMRELRFPE
jgi:TolB-like protein/tetratricopeptide (TPR) repeat protein